MKLPPRQSFQICHMSWQLKRCQVEWNVHSWHSAYRRRLTSLLVLNSRLTRCPGHREPAPKCLFFAQCHGTCTFFFAAGTAWKMHRDSASLNTNKKLDVETRCQPLKFASSESWCAHALHLTSFPHIRKKQSKHLRHPLQATASNTSCEQANLAS